MKSIIIYTTKYGCTEKAVKLLRSKLPADVQAFNLEKDRVPDLSLFDTVILGGPIYVGKLQKSLSSFTQNHLEELKTKRLALFVCAGEQDAAKSKEQFAAAFSQELFQYAFVREEFGGEMRTDKISFIEKLMIRLVKGIKESYFRLSEDKIYSFTKKINVYQ
ncbi:MAG: flavodoxin domain-containing protein [Ruminiclostridium sp.]